MGEIFAMASPEPHHSPANVPALFAFRPSRGKISCATRFTELDFDGALMLLSNRALVFTVHAPAPLRAEKLRQRY